MHADLRDAIRSLRTDWRFALVASTLLAVTLGTLTAVFAIVQAIVLQPFPFRDQDRVVVVWQRDLRRAQPVIEVAHGEATDWLRRSRSFAQMAVVGSVNWSLDLVRNGEPQRLSLAAVSAPFFDVLGAPPTLGRGFAERDEVGSAPRVAVISHGLWVRTFGRDRSIVGRAISVRLDVDRPAIPLEVVGVASAAFDYPRGSEIWVPAAPLVRGYAGPGDDPEEVVGILRVFFGLARLKPGVDTAAAEADLTRTIRTTDPKGGPEPASNGVVTPIASYLLGPARPVLWTLLGGAALMLLIVCANVAGLQVSRATSRQRVLAIRAALGASTTRLVRQTLIESVLLTSIAGVGALCVALATARILIAMAPEGVPRLDTVALLDLRVLAFGAGVTFATILLSALWPARVAARLDTVRILAHGARLASDAGGRRVQRAVVVLAGRGMPDARRGRRVVRAIGSGPRSDDAGLRPAESAGGLRDPIGQRADELADILRSPRSARGGAAGRRRRRQRLSAPAERPDRPREPADISRAGAHRSEDVGLEPAVEPRNGHAWLFQRHGHRDRPWAGLLAGRRLYLARSGDRQRKRGATTLAGPRSNRAAHAQRVVSHRDRSACADGRPWWAS